MEWGGRDVFPNAIVVDPFLGRAAMGIAVGRLGHGFEGTGRGPECAKIAEVYIAHWGEDGSKILFSFTPAKALFFYKVEMRHSDSVRCLEIFHALTKSHICARTQT